MATIPSGLFGSLLGFTSPSVVAWPPDHAAAGACRDRCSPSKKNYNDPVSRRNSPLILLGSNQSCRRDNELVLMRPTTRLHTSWTAPPGALLSASVCANTDIDKLAAAHQVNTWTYITAYNPGSVAASSEGNEKRQRELIQAVAESGYPFYTGEGKGDSGEWPAEPSLLVLGVGEAEAAAMARRFGQAAVLFGERDRPVRLLWTDGDSATSSQET